MTSSPFQPHRPLRGAALLLVAAVIWGLAFVPQQWTVTALLPLQATLVRFAIAAPLALALANKRLLHPGVAAKDALLLGTLLFAAYALQTAALVHAPVARVSLITGLYAVFVPLLAPFVGQGRPTALHWAGAGLALLGLLGLTGVVGGELLAVPLNRGDVFVVLSALVGACQVLLVGKLAKVADPFALNALQLTVVLLLALPTCLLFEGLPNLSLVDGNMWIAFVYLAVFSTVIAFTCQVFGQRHTSASTAAVIMLLETPIGVLAALVLLQETLSPLRWSGAFILLLGVAVALHTEMRAPQSVR